MKTLFLALSVIALSACTSMPKKMNSLSRGMSKSEVIQTMGTPNSTAADSNGETLVYKDGPHVYLVQLKDGKVDAYGEGPVDQVELEREARRKAAARAAFSQIGQPQQAYQIPVNRPMSCTSNKLGQTTYTNCN
jgi:outer membrane protein assembly factor BamE (lipoprotein component of BamABCDE complex)